MTKKYIVKNCPSIYTGWRTMHECFHYNKPCTDCADCLIKQVVEKCQFRSKICKDCGSDVCFECEHLTGGILANEILQSFTIEEVK